MQVGAHNSVQRRNYLRQRYNFDCTCKFCSTEAKEWDVKLAGWQCVKCSAPILVPHAMDASEPNDSHVKCSQWVLLAYLLCCKPVHCRLSTYHCFLCGLT